MWLGFNQAFVPYERDARHAGGTHFPFFSKNPWKTFALGVTSFSFLPIYACAALAAVGLLASGMIFAAAGASWTSGSPAADRTALIGVITFFWATILLAIAAVGLYLIRIYKDVRGRPPYVVQSAVGVSTSALKDNRVLPSQPEQVE